MTKMVSGGRRRVHYTFPDEGESASPSHAGRPRDMAPKGYYATARYKQREKTDEQARLFPDLQAEIAERRPRLVAKPSDQGFQQVGLHDEAADQCSTITPI